MKRKALLEKRLKRLEEKRTSLIAAGKACTDAGELRAINDRLEDLNADIEDIKEEISAIDEDEKERSKEPVEGSEKRSIPEGAVLVNGGKVMGSFKTEGRSEESPLETMEYRKAFKAYVQRGIPIPQHLLPTAEQRAGEAINTGDTGAAIPLTIMNEVINTVRKRYGNLYSKVRKVSVRGGVEYPIGALEASFKWINEKTVAPRQKVGDLGNIQFSYHTAEIRVAQTFLSQLLSLSAFEAEITRVIAVAYLKAMDDGIVNGSGQGAMTGILNDPRVTNTITMTAADINNWVKWRKNFFSKLPLGYRSGEFIFPVGTVDSYLETMADANNNPVFRQATGLEVKDGDALNPNGRFFGREISLVEPDIIADFDSASAGDVIGVYWQPESYAINENFGFSMFRYFDHEQNEWVDKAIVVVDGKVLNPTGFYKIIKG